MPKSTADIISLSNVLTNSLRATDLGPQVQGAVGALVMLQTYAAQTVQQAAIDPAVIGDVGVRVMPLLAEHQVAARQNAGYLLGTAAPKIITALTDIIAYGTMLDTFSGVILPLVPKMLDDAAVRGQVQALLAQLELEAGARGANARALGALIATASSQADANAKDLGEDYAEAEKVLGSESGELTRIRQEIADTRRKIGGEIAGVVVSALVTTAGIVTIGVGALATLPAGVAGASVVLAGVGLTATGAAGLAAAAALLSNSNSALADLYQRAAALQLTLTLVGAVGDQVRTIATSVGEMATSVGALMTEWASIERGIGDFRKDVAQASDASDIAHLTASVQLARKDWATIAQQVQALMLRAIELNPQPVPSVAAQNAAA